VDACPKDCIVLIADMCRQWWIMQLLKKLNKPRLTDDKELQIDFAAWLQWIVREQEQRTVARKKAQQAKAMKKGSQKR